MPRPSNQLALALTSGKFVVTAECLPPASADPTEVNALSDSLPPGLDAVVVADNPDAIRSSALACAALLVAHGRPIVLSMVTRDRNRIALESDALGAGVLGVGGILSLSGHHQSLGVCPQAAGVYDIDSIQFSQTLHAMRCEGRGSNGRKLNLPPDLLIGAAAHPGLQPLELNLLQLRKKVAAGADFVLTDAVEDVAAFSGWMEAVRAAGLDSKVAIIASVSPAGGAGKAALLKSISGVRGIHILSGGCEGSAADLLSAAGLT